MLGTMVTVEDGPGVTDTFRRQMENGVRVLSGDLVVRLRRLVLSLLALHNLYNTNQIQANTVMWTCRTHGAHGRVEPQIFKALQDKFGKAFPGFDVRCAMVGYSGAQGTAHWDRAPGLRVVIPLLHHLSSCRKIVFFLGALAGGVAGPCRRCFTLAAQDAYIATARSRGAVRGPKRVETTLRHQATGLGQGDMILLIDLVPKSPLDEEAFLVSGAVEKGLREAARSCAPPHGEVLHISKRMGRKAARCVSGLGTAWAWSFQGVPDHVVELESKQEREPKKRGPRKPAWNKGKKTGRPAWNKGKKTGRPAWNKGKKTGRPAWNKGKKMGRPAWNKGKPGWNSEKNRLALKRGNKAYWRKKRGKGKARYFGGLLAVGLLAVGLLTQSAGLGVFGGISWAV